MMILTVGYDDDDGLVYASNYGFLDPPTLPRSLCSMPQRWINTKRDTEVGSRSSSTPRVKYHCVMMFINFNLNSIGI